MLNLKQPWDSETNRQALQHNADFYQAKGLPPGMTRMLLVTGPGTLYDGDREPKQRGISNPSETICAIYVGADKAVPWTKPADFVLDPENPKAGLGEPEGGKYFVLMHDGSVRQLQADMDPLEFLQLCQLEKI
ncbi:hypothetical protein Pla8534_30660 [Lignipirellula cremea]|uniref:Uncharacterized protein n=2 Tax=Lignipirellula cremea TaxID=2528010 RepID=A0A518DTT4_9BACT|nr:hypothetical protein Pla8534_30660 [Lignipirellula cremea]